MVLALSLLKAVFLGLCSQYWGGYICYAFANIKAPETLGYTEHICNYVVILDSWFYGVSGRVFMHGNGPFENAAFFVA